MDGPRERGATGVTSAKSESTATGFQPIDPVNVKRALRALVDGTAPPFESGGKSTRGLTAAEPTTVVDRAHESLTEVESAAAFADDGGLDRLQAAIAVAERADQRNTARAGQRALAIVHRYRRAAAGDHFQPGHGTVFRPDSQVASE